MMPLNHIEGLPESERMAFIMGLVLQPLDNRNFLAYFIKNGNEAAYLADIAVGSHISSTALAGIAYNRLDHYELLETIEGNPMGIKIKDDKIEDVRKFLHPHYLE